MTRPPPEFQFVRAQSGGYHWPKHWTLALASTGRFFRSAQGRVLFLAQTSPDEFIALGRYAELKAIIEDGAVLRLTGDTPDESEWKFLYYALNDHRWRLPSASNRASAPVRQ
jgi:hypothetical protein